MPRQNAESVVPIDRARSLDNQMRLQVEAIQGLEILLHTDERTRAWLAKRLDVKPPYITKIFAESQNFTLAQIADLYHAFGRTVHLVLGTNPDEMRMPKDEKLSQKGVMTTRSSSDASYLMQNYGHLAKPSVTIDFDGDGLATDQQARIA